MISRIQTRFAPLATQTPVRMRCHFSGAHGRLPGFNQHMVHDAFAALRSHFFSPYNRSGSTWISLTDIVEQIYNHPTADLRQASKADITRALKQSDPRGVFHFDPKTNRLYLAREKQLAEKIVEFLHAAKRKMKPEVAARIESATTAEGHPLTEEQKQALRMAWVEPICIITGGPGTGKTTVQKALGELIRDFGEGPFLSFAKEAKIAFLSPTGVAARRQAEVTGFDSQTIYKALYPKPDARGNLRNTRKSMDHPWIAVDEVSMVDIFLANELLRICNPQKTHVVLFGDDQQLPSVDLGNVLGDLKRVSIQGQAIPTVKLTEVKRQGSESPIRKVAVAIQEQKRPDFATMPCTEVSCDENQTNPDVVASVMQLIESGELQPLQGMILAYTNRTVWALNLAIQQRCNPHGLSVKVDRQAEDGSAQYFDLRIGDRVVHLKNNYQLNVANGEIGMVTDIKPDSKTQFLTVQFKGHKAAVHYRPEEINDLGLAYAITTHKAQGSEFDEVTLVLEPNMYRSLLYTAVTRAKKKLRFIGDLRNYDRAVTRDPERQTLLQEWIEQAAAATPRVSASTISAPQGPRVQRKGNPRQGGLFGN